MQCNDPLPIVKKWLPHLIWLTFSLFVFWMLFKVFAPILNALLLAASMAALTYPILFKPIESVVRKFAKFGEEKTRICSGFIATGALICVILTPFTLLIISTVGPIKNVGDILAGVILKDEQKSELLLDHIEFQAQQLKKLYPNFPMEPEKAREVVANIVKDAGNFSKSYLSFLFRGTGGLAVHLVLAVISICFFYTYGAKLVYVFMSFTPFSKEEVAELLKYHEDVVLRLLTDTLASAFLRGVGWGFLGWIFTGLNFFIIALVGTFLGLVPMVGNAMVWFPLASIMWSKERIIAAIAFTVLCFGVNFAVGHFRKKVVSHMHQQNPWMGFMLLISIIGGILTFGVQGFIVGPMVIVLFNVVSKFFIKLYARTSD